MKEKLKDNPDMDFCFDDNTEAMTLLAELGLLGKLIENAPTNTPRGNAVVHGDFGTHYVVGILYAGHARPENNGYRVACLSNTKRHPNDVVLIATLLVSDAVHQPDVSESFKLNP